MSFLLPVASATFRLNSGSICQLSLLIKDNGGPIAPIANQAALSDRPWSQKYAKYYSAIHQAVLY